ncbi:hypothetical protein KKE28_02070, partial [Patescibacteria group bacterium]|nr:hypothetical protein [Patescibacteria group bacterium]
NKIFDFTLFGICIFLAAYTEWLGFLLAGTAGLYAIINWQKPWSKKILLISFLGASSALALTLGQMHLALGLKTALEALRTKFLVRTGIEASTEYSRFSPYAWFKIILNYLRGYDFILIATLIAIITLLRKKWTMLTSWLKSTAATPLLTFLFIAGLPVCLHHALLFQWTAVHPFSPLKMAPLITVLAGLCFAYIITHTLQRVKVNTAWKYTIFFIVAFSVFSFLSKTSFCSSDYERRSSFIRNLSKQNEVIFRKQIDKEIEPFLISKRVFYALYSGRNVSIWDNLKNAKQLLQKNGVSDGILFEMNAADPTSLKYVRFNLQSTEEDLEAGFNRFNH